MPRAASWVQASSQRAKRHQKEEQRGKRREKIHSWFFGTGQALGHPQRKASSYCSTQEHFTIHREHFPPKRMISKSQRRAAIKVLLALHGSQEQGQLQGMWSPGSPGAAGFGGGPWMKELTTVPDAPSLLGELRVSCWSPLSLSPCLQLKHPSSGGCSWVLWSQSVL